jgi:hypothetical protein
MFPEKEWEIRKEIHAPAQVQPIAVEFLAIKKNPPLSGEAMPVRQRMRVVLPAPFGPSKLTIWPGSITSDT